MDLLEIKTEPPEFVVNIFHSFSNNDVNDENQIYEYDPLDVTIDQPVLSNFVRDDIGENGVNYETQDNGDFSSELTLISVSFFFLNLFHKFYCYLQDSFHYA